jgi:hypothetical protein
MMSISLNELEESEALRVRIKFIHNLAALYHRQESRKSSPVKRAEPHDEVQASKRLRSPTRAKDRAESSTLSRSPESAMVKLEDVELIDETYPIRLDSPICLICMGDE